MLRCPTLLAPRQKPLIPLRLDRSHPLAEGMTRCYVFNEMVGKVLYDLASGWQATLQAGTQDWNIVDGEPSHHFANSTSPYYKEPLGDTASFAASTGFSCAFRVKVTDTTSENGSLWGTYGYSSTEDRVGVHFPYVNTFYFDYGLFASSRLTVSTSGYASQWVDAAYINEGSGGNYCAAYLDGILKASKSTSDTPSLLDVASVGMEIGRSPYIATGNKGDLAHLYFYNRVLSVPEICALRDDPYQMLVPA